MHQIHVHRGNSGEIRDYFRYDSNVIKFMNNKQLTIKKRHGLGGHKEQLLCFFIRLCYTLMIN